MKLQKYVCPCCGALSLDDENAWEICEICDWEDDPLQHKKPDLRGGANVMSLNEAKKNFKENILFKKFINQDHYCPLMDSKIKDGLCCEIIAATQENLIYDAIREISDFKREEVCLICSSCPINKAQ